MHSCRLCFTFRVFLVGAVGDECPLPLPSPRRHCDSQRPKPWGTALTGERNHQVKHSLWWVINTCAYNWFPPSEQTQTRIKYESLTYTHTHNYNSSCWQCRKKHSYNLLSNVSQTVKVLQILLRTRLQIHLFIFHRRFLLTHVAKRK